MVPNLVLSGLCAWAGWTDATSGKIANRLTYTGIALGLTLAAWQGWDRFTGNLAAVVFGFASLILFWYWQMIGGGDVKLAMMVGAFKGTAFLLHFLFYALSFSLVVVLFVLIMRLGIWKASCFVLTNLKSMVLLRAFPQPPKEMDNTRIPFGLAAFLAVMVCLILEESGLMQTTLVG